MQQTQKKTFPGAGEFDPINSFYYHKIYCTTGRILKGYSKSKHYPEMLDKIMLLEKIILRLTNGGYLNPDRAMKIEFYKKAFLDKNDELLLTLSPTGFTFAGNESYIMNENLNGFLRRLFDQLKEGRIETASLIKRNAVEQSDPFDLGKPRFKSEPELMEHVLRQHKSGQEHGTCFDFYFKYKEKYL